MPSPGGMCPLSRLLARTSHSSLGNAAQRRRYHAAQSVVLKPEALQVSQAGQLGGITPINWLSLTCSSCRLDKLPSSGGFPRLVGCH